MEPCGAAGLSIVVSLEWIQFQPDPHDFVDLRIFGTEFPDPLYLNNQIREIINQSSLFNIVKTAVAWGGVNM